MGLDKTSHLTGEGKSSEGITGVVTNGTNSNLGVTLSAKDEVTYYSYLGKADRKLIIEKFKDSIIEQISTQQPYAAGSEGVIYKIVLPDTKGGSIELLVAKKRFDNNPDNEYALQERIGDLTEDGDPVTVPVLWGEIPHEGDKYIVMDFIRGKTLYHKIAEGIIEARAKQIEASATGKTETEKNLAYQESFNLRNRIKSAKSDSDVDHIFLEWYQYDSKKTDEAFDREKLKVQIFGSEEGKKIIKELGEFIEKLHKNGFYHRDLHEKNIIFGDDGKIYVIDFGKTFFKDPEEGRPSDTEVYVVDMGEQEGVYVKDEEILGIISKITKTEDQEEGEKLSQQSRERAKELTKGAMMIELVDFKKIKSKKLLSRIKNNFGGFEQLKEEVLREEKGEYSIDSFLGINDKDFILSLFSITRENLELILKEGISKREKDLLKDIKSKRFPKLEKSRHLFLDDDGNVKINDLCDALDKMWKKKGYEEIYKGTGLDFLRELKPMWINAQKLVEIEKVKGYLEEIYNAIA